MTRFYSQDQFHRDLRQFELARDDGVTLVDVKRRRDQLLHLCHPDIGGSNEEAQEINAAYERLRSRLHREVERKAILRNIRRGIGVVLVVGAGALLAGRRHGQK